MRRLIVAILATACAFTPVAAAQTAGPTGSGGVSSEAQVKTPPAKAQNVRRAAKKRVADCGKAAPAKALTTRAGTPRPPAPTKA